MLPEIRVGNETPEHHPSQRHTIRTAFRTFLRTAGPLPFPGTREHSRAFARPIVQHSRLPGTAAFETGSEQHGFRVDVQPEAAPDRVAEPGVGGPARIGDFGHQHRVQPMPAADRTSAPSAGSKGGWSTSRPASSAPSTFEGREVQSRADLADQEQLAPRLPVGAAVEGADPSCPVPLPRMPAAEDHVASLQGFDLHPVRAAPARPDTATSGVSRPRLPARSPPRPPAPLTIGPTRAATSQNGPPISSESSSPRRSSYVASSNQRSSNRSRSKSRTETGTSVIR